MCQVQLSGPGFPLMITFWRQAPGLVDDSQHVVSVVFGKCQFLIRFAPVIQFIQVLLDYFLQPGGIHQPMMFRGICQIKLDIGQWTVIRIYVDNENPVGIIHLQERFQFDMLSPASELFKDFPDCTERQVIGIGK